jgi:hypothetical protein
MWYEWSLALDILFRVDVKNKKAVFYDEGATKVNASIWTQCGRALAALLSLPESGTSPSVSDWANKPFSLSSFRVSQRDILDSVNRVQNKSDKDWSISYESSEKCYADGLAALGGGDRSGFVKAMSARHFFLNEDGEYETTRGISNEVLGLPEEDLDTSTKKATEWVESGWNPVA